MQKEELVLQYLQELIKNTPVENMVLLAGGGVRDLIMGNPVKDIDVVVTMPDGGIEFANWITKRIGAYKEGTNPIIYPRFGTAKFNLRKANYKGVDISDINIESVMTRGEKYQTGSRKPDVVYAELKEDAFRRDLTVNSLFKNISTGKIEDLTGMGLNDIKNGIVRTPLDPDITFQDDPLRMLRVVRFAVKYNWKMSLSMIKALKRNSGMLKNISSERIQDELNKILMTTNPDKGLKILSLTGLNRFVIPELDKCVGVTQNVHHHQDVFDHICDVVKHTSPDLTARLASLFHDIGKPETKSVTDTGVHFYQHEDVGAKIAQQAMSRLRYSNEMIHAVSNIVQHHMQFKAGGQTGEHISDKHLRRFMAALGNDLPAALKVMQADNLSHAEGSVMPNQIPNIANRMHTISQHSASPKPALPINGSDIMQLLNIPAGPMIKQLRAAVEDAWYENPQLSRQDALELVKRAYKKLATNEPEQSSYNSDVLNQKILNPETGQHILVKTALGYEKSHPAHTVAAQMIEKSKKRT